MRRKLTRQEWRRRKTIRRISLLGAVTLAGVGVLCLFCLIIGRIAGISEKDVMGSFFPTKKVGPVEVTEMLLTPNPYSRPGDPLEQVNGIVIHYTANPETDAQANRNYFEGLKDTQTTSASSHYIIGLDGTVIQCIPLDEIAYATSKERNQDTISIECCHKDETGRFTKATRESLVRLTAWLCGEYNLKKKEILRHYDVTGKDCPRYFARNEEKWEEFREDVFDYIDRYEEPDQEGKSK